MYIGLEAIMFHRDNLTMTDHYNLPNLSLSTPGYIQPSFKIPSGMILNQSNPEGIDFCSINLKDAEIFITHFLQATTHSS